MEWKPTTLCFKCTTAPCEDCKPPNTGWVTNDNGEQILVTTTTGKLTNCSKTEIK